MALPRESHGESSPGKRTKEYKAWSAMKDRCHNPRCASYKDYGARGITVCDRWRNSYLAFLEDMGRSTEHKTLDRIDNNKGYNKENCQWVTMKIQTANKRNSFYVTYNDIEMHLLEACELSGIKPETVRARKRMGWPESDWFKPSVDGRGKHGNQKGKNPLYVTYNGEEITINEAIKLSGLNYETVMYRVRSGWDEEDWLLPADSGGNRLS